MMPASSPMPPLGISCLLGASDGLIVLMDREHRRLARVLNPLTGDMLHFAAPLWEHLRYMDKLYASVTGGPPLMLVVWQKWDYRRHTVIYGDPTNAKIYEAIHCPMLLDP
jgi:hypothetical protein